MYFGLIVILISIISNYLLIHLFGINGAAMATTLSTFIGTMLTSVYVYRNFKTFVSFKSVIKIGFTSLLIYYFALRYQFSGIKIIITYLILLIVYILILFAIKEIKIEDFTLVKNIIRK